MDRLKFIVTFININGFYLALALTAITIGLNNSSLVSLPVKGIVILLMGAGIFLYVRKINIYDSYLYAFIVFIGLYVVKLFIEANNPNPYLLHPIETLSLYMIAHCILPFVFYYFLVGRKDYQLIFNALFYSGVIFNISVYFIYGKLLIAGVGRLGNWQTSQVTEDLTLSPLVLAYSSMVVIILSVFSLISQKLDLRRIILYTFAILSAIPAFLLGASRGAMIGLLLSLLLYLIISNKVSKSKMIFYFGLLAFGVFNLALMFDSAIFDRFTGLFEQNSPENLRFVLYETTYKQFEDSPLIGGSIQNDTVHHFPHNIYLEAMTATGIFGFLALTYLTLSAIRRVFFIFSKDSSAGWIGLLFITYFIHSLFNAALYLAVGFWVFLAMLLGYKKVTNNLNK